MLKIFKNEILKFLYGKKLLWLLLCLLGSIIFFTILTLNFNKSTLTINDFMRSYFKGFFLSPILPLILIIFTAQIVAEDYSIGCTKFFLISKIKKEDIITGKLAFLILIILISLVFSFAASLLIGAVFFSGLSDLTSIIKLYTICIPALISICGFTAVVALLCDSFQNTLMISMGSYIFMTILDNLLPKAKYFTITYPLSAGGNVSSVPIVVISLIYLTMFIIFSVRLMKEKDVVL